MLTKMLMTRGISPLVEGLPLSVRLDKIVVKPGSTAILVVSHPQAYEMS
jgi:hypothetical protein